MLNDYETRAIERLDAARARGARPPRWRQYAPAPAEPPIARPADVDASTGQRKRRIVVLDVTVGGERQRHVAYAARSKPARKKRGQP